MKERAAARGVVPYSSMREKSIESATETETDGDAEGETDISVSTDTTAARDNDDHRMDMDMEREEDFDDGDEDEDEDDGDDGEGDETIILPTRSFLPGLTSQTLPSSPIHRARPDPTPIRAPPPRELEREPAPILPEATEAVVSTAAPQVTPEIEALVVRALTTIHICHLMLVCFKS